METKTKTARFIVNNNFKPDAMTKVRLDGSRVCNRRLELVESPYGRIVAFESTIIGRGSQTTVTIVPGIYRRELDHIGSLRQMEVELVAEEIQDRVSDLLAKAKHLGPVIFWAAGGTIR
ncbi:Uncharacterised protein [uncultured archaeon]|nr:Uncharacterised protein [uncultured archaeon]